MQGVEVGRKVNRRGGVSAKISNDTIRGTKIWERARMWRDMLSGLGRIRKSFEKLYKVLSLWLCCCGYHCCSILCKSSMSYWLNCQMPLSQQGLPKQLILETGRKEKPAWAPVGWRQGRSLYQQDTRKETALLLRGIICWAPLSLWGRPATSWRIEPRYREETNNGRLRAKPLQTPGGALLHQTSSRHVRSPFTA